MTQLSVPSVVRPVRDLLAVPGAQVVSRAGADVVATPRSPGQLWPVRSAATALLGAAVVLALLDLAGLGPDPWIAVTMVLAWPLLLAAQGCWVRRPLGESFTAGATRVLRAGAALGLLSWAATPLLGSSAPSASMLLATAGLTATGVAATCLARGSRAGARVVLVGHADDIDSVAAELRRSGSETVVGGCVPSEIVHQTGFPVRSGVESAVAHAMRLGADTLVFLPGPDLPPALVRRLQWQASAFGIGTYVGTGLLDVASFRMSLASGPGLNLVHVRPSAATGVRRVVKEVAERSLAALALLLLTPVLATVALLVRTDSPGPALFRQQRTGRDGRMFTMYKFRTMSCTAEDERAQLIDRNEGAGLLFKVRSDPRVTRIGAVLRRYSLDELPQLWNVVNGTMALVGPRPALPDEVARYDLDPRRRLAVKPGLTGLWQVSGRSDLDWEQSVRLDLRYVDNWSLRLDAEILVRTVRAVLDHRGAY